MDIPVKNSFNTMGKNTYHKKILDTASNTSTLECFCVINKTQYVLHFGRKYLATLNV